MVKHQHTHSGEWTFPLVCAVQHSMKRRTH
jgi:hypothetical protein